MYQLVRWSLASVALLTLVVTSARLVHAHETDQYCMPVGRDMVDMGDYFTRWFYEAIDRGVKKTDAKIDEAVKSGRSGDDLKSLQSDDAVAHAINSEFPYAIWLIQHLDDVMTSPDMHARYPGMTPGFKPAPSMAQVLAFPANPFRAWGSSTVMVCGVQIGADKIGHFTDMGMHYYQTYKGYLVKGEPEQQAMRKAIEVGIYDPLKGESKLLGYWTAGDYSNGDLAVNYLGMIFYRNLTEPQMLKGVMRPPMLVHDGPYWKIAPHVRPDSDFLALFMSNHLDEALNPGLFVPGMRDGLRKHAIDNYEGTLEHRLDRWGNRRSQAWFARETHNLWTYYGYDYGHDGNDKTLIMIGDFCFAQPSDPSARDKVGRSPLHRAVAFADAARVQQQLAAGADVNDPVRSNESYNSNWGDTPLHMAVQDGRDAIVQILIARGADVSRANDRGTTPLHRAVEYPNIMTALIDAGSKVDAVDVQGRTPLHWAAMGIDKSSMAMLLGRGANPNASDSQGQTPLHYAARFGDADGVKTLLAAGANANARDTFGATPLHVSAAARQVAATEALLRSGALAATKDQFGVTPLHDAARHGAETIVALLLSAGADPSVADVYGSTPLHMAARFGYDAVAMRLVRAGANPMARSGPTRRGITAVQAADQSGYRELAEALSAPAAAQAASRKMSTQRFWACVIGGILLATFGGGGCSAGGNVSLSDWRHSVENYVQERGKGDPAILREVTWPESRREFTKIGGDDPHISQDVRGVLLGFRQIGDKRWFVFIVGVVNKEVVEDIRVEAMSLQDSNDYTWRTSSANPKALGAYVDYRTRLWKQRFPGRQTAPAQYTVFPQEADVFDLQVAQGTATVSHPASGAHWQVVIDSKATGQ